ncbi:unnamed protein product [Rhodiola kirilowii]
MVVASTGSEKDSIEEVIQAWYIPRGPTAMTKNLCPWICLLVILFKRTIYKLGQDTSEKLNFTGTKPATHYNLKLIKSKPYKPPSRRNEKTWTEIRCV